MQTLQIDSNDGVTFRSTDVVDFSLADGREIDVYERDTNTQEPSRYLITKKVKAISATEKTTTISFTSYKPKARRSSVVKPSAANLPSAAALACAFASACANSAW